jgi:hypothetical protein
MLSVSLFLTVLSLLIVVISSIRIPCMLNLIVWSNIIIIEIGFILGAILLLTKAGHEEDSDDPGRMSSTEVEFTLIS